MTGNSNVIHSLCIRICAIFLAPCLVGAEVGRQLSQPKICGYSPSSDTGREMSIDLDQQEFEKHLASGNMVAAKAVYTLGGNAGAAALIGLPALAKPTAYGAVVKQGSVAVGLVSRKVEAGAKHLEITYAGTCKDGGLATKDLSGCFKMGGGDIKIEGVSVGAPTSVANTYATLAGFSVGGQHEMGAWRWQELFTVYRAYYNKGDYANQRVVAALDKTGFCANCEVKDRSEVAQRASVYMNVWMYVVAKMEQGISNCRHGCLSCKLEVDVSGASLLDTSTHAWDLAVAYYTGSLSKNSCTTSGTEGTKGTSDGLLLFELAQETCALFGTCTAPPFKRSAATQSTGGAAVNKKIMDEFAIGQYKILSGKCVEAIAAKRRIVELMSVPLVQGALHHAYKVEKLVRRSEVKAAGAAFAAAILPRVAACNAPAAKIIADHMNIDVASAATTTSFIKVKQAFESTYDCLGITCEDVGGLLSSEGGKSYYPSAEPCISRTATTAAAGDSDGLGIEIIIIISAIGGLLLITCGIAICCCRRANKYERMAKDNIPSLDAVGAMATPQISPPGTDPKVAVDDIKLHVPRAGGLAAGGATIGNVEPSDIEKL
jgi:hypothetical protein